MGFFNVLPESKESRKVIPISRQSLDRLGCSNCTLDKEKLTSPKMDATGPNNPEMYFIAEAPGEEEDKNGQQLHPDGRSGNFVRSRVPSRWKNRIRYNNVINCRPPGNRKPTELEIECCRKRIVEDIVLTKPKAIVGFGDFPLRWFANLGQIRDVWRGRRLALRLEWKGKSHSFWYYPMLHPSFVVRMGGESYRGSDWADEFSADLKRVFADADQGFPKAETHTEADVFKGLTVWKPSDDFEEWLERIRNFGAGQYVGYDIETKNLIPYKRDSKILTTALSTGDETIAFPVGHREASLPTLARHRLFLAVEHCLTHAQRVIAQNAPMEQEWMVIKMPNGEGVVREIRWGDSLAQYYTLDERKGGKALGELTLMHFGIDIKKLSKVNTKRLDEESLGDVLKYNGPDAKYCKLVWMRQRGILVREGLYGTSALHEKRQLQATFLETRGLYPNVKAAKKFHDEYTEIIEEAEEEIHNSPEVKQYMRRKGKFDPRYHEDVKSLFTSLGMEIENTQEETLASLRHPLAKAILRMREFDKLDSYAAPIAEGEIVQPDGRIHPRISMTKTSTGRPAAEEPNVYNYPKREHKELREVIQSPPNHYMLAADMGQGEFRTAAMCSKDKQLIEFCWTDYDVHAYWLKEINKVYPKWVRGKAKDMGIPEAYKKARDYVKNQWVFPALFGAQLSSRAGYLSIPEEILAPLDEQFWDELRGVKLWHEEIIAQFKKHRYVTSLVGRRRHWGEKKPMTPNEAINMPIQGTLADLVTDAQQRLDRLAYERDEPWLGAILNIYDDLSFYIPIFRDIHGRPSDSKLWDVCVVIGREMVMSPFKFVNVPLLVEMNLGKTWNDLKMFEEVKMNSKDFGMRRAA